MGLLIRRGTIASKIFSKLVREGRAELVETTGDHE